jgi:hypothetical protein
VFGNLSIQHAIIQNSFLRLLCEKKKHQTSDITFPNFEILFFATLREKLSKFNLSVFNHSKL